MSVHPFDDAQLDRQVEIAAEDPDTARDMGVFEVDSLDRANRVVWRIGQLRGQLAQAEALYRSEVERLNEWREAERRRVGQQVDFLASLAETYHRRLLADDKRRKTVRVPAGELKARKAQDHWEIDDAVLIDWAVRNGRDDLINRPDPKVDRTAVKKAIKPSYADSDEDGLTPTVDPTTGTPVAGVRVHVALDDDLTFSVKTPEVDR